MSNVLSVTLAMPPRPQQRLIAALQQAGPKCPTCHKPRKQWATNRPDTRKTKNGEPYKVWRRRLEDTLRIAWIGNPPINGPIRVTVTFVLRRPANRPSEPKHTTRKVRGTTLKVLNPRHQGGNFFVSPEDWKRGDRVFSSRKPDLDRLVNSMYDAMTEARIWWDDAQVATLTTSKWLAAKGEKPHIRLRVEPA